MQQAASVLSRRAASLEILIGVAAIVVSFAGVPAVVEALDLAPLTTGMLQHIVIMNLLAPLIAHMLAGIALVRCQEKYAPRRLAMAMTFQLLALWLWHAPPLHHAAMASPSLHAVMILSLLGASLWFWIEVFSHRGSARWRVLVALLVTGKLFCLLGALLTFAPNPLYMPVSVIAGPGHPALAVSAAIADQQAAGLLMLAACPLTYILAGIVIAARWLGELQRRPPELPRHFQISEGVAEP
ncbi:MAG: cytochrome c oxidase assembly protein [Alphaproteobacteria bacterium]|nr:cytochrome c oxidase assembly protein [Alphaproteobacteria bacterium]